MEKDYRTASGKFWQTDRRLRRGKQLSANTVYGGGGELLVSTGDIVGRWKEYFEDLLNPTDTPSVEEPEAEDSEVDSFITQAEVTEVVQQLLGGKAPGVDEICPEYLKSLNVVGLSWLTRLCNIAWRSGTVPLDWATGVVVPLFKKGDRRVCSNYRGITLLSLPGKVYSRVLERRVRPLIEPWIQEEQCGFRPSRGTLDQLYTLHRVLEGLWEFAQPVHMCFVDLEKAFDHVPRGILWEVLWEYGIRGPLLRAVRSLYNRSRSLVRIASCKSDLFPVHVGLQQGCPLSPVLFIVFMDRISRRGREEGVWFGDHRISLLIFADDVVLLASSGLDLQHALGRFAAECEAAGMRVSTSKSEAMVLDRKKVVCTLQVGGEVRPQVEEFKYLGVLFTSEGRIDCEIDRRIGAAAAVMRSMYRFVVEEKELSRKAKLSIYQSIYVPTLTYGHELWVMTERVRSRIQAAEMSFLCRVAGRSLRDRVRSSVTREELRVEPLLLHIERGQLRWLGHLFRMPPGHLPGEVFRACPTGKRPRGRPRTRWRDYVFRLAWEHLGVPPEELEEVAREREDTSPNTDPAELREIIVRQGAVIRFYQDQVEALQNQLRSASTAAPWDPPSARGESPRLAMPEKIDGSADRCRGFLRQCEVFFSHQPGIYGEEGTWCAFLLSLLTSRALEWASAIWDADPQIRSSFSYFAGMIREVFEYPAGGKDISIQLMELCQGSGSAADYAIKFRTLAAQSGWNDAALWAVFHAGLNPALQTELACHVEATSLMQFVATAICLDNLLCQHQAGTQPSAAAWPCCGRITLVLGRRFLNLCSWEG
ncbi:hypothetical protein QTP70_011124 [Hemibagrus guttatus]|uniref:Reverse transcriptase domain-containing protein n=1 Tax=Hemibagrus guttatus TaxID=175788 RepID=A0AAE0V497_9TELE|nr:hypothetical protein QTP70_011124 [Hemibagrus guttatus]